MSQPVLSLHDLLNHPAMNGQITKDRQSSIEQALTKEDQDTGTPCYIRTLAGLGAWFATLFILCFLFAADIIDEEAGSFVVGILFLVAGIALNLKKGSVFVRQSCLSLVFSGHMLVILGSVLAIDDHITVICATHGILCLTVYPLFADSIYRFIVPVVFSMLAVCVIIDGHWFHSIPILVATEATLTGVLLLNTKLPKALTPLLYASIVMLPSTFLLIDFTQIGAVRELFDFLYHIPVLPSSALESSSLILSLGLMVFFVILAGGPKAITKPWMMIVLAATALLGAFTTPGILAMIGILAGGYSRDDRVIMGLAYLFLFCFLVLFYYTLHVDLAYKSWVLGGSGLLLLVIRVLAGLVRPREVIA